MAAEIDPETMSRLLGVWADPQENLSDALANALIELIKSGRLPGGAKLPSQRRLANCLGTARGTVVLAYQVGVARGYLHCEIGSGTWVRSQRGRNSAMSSGRLFSFTSTQSSKYDLSSGALPANPVFERTLNHFDPEGVKAYLDTEGYFPRGIPVLRHKLAQMLSASNIDTAANQIMVTCGAQHATFLISQLVGPGDKVIVENPSYRGALESFKHSGVQLIPVDRTKRSWELNQLADRIKETPAMIYCQSGFHNPSGQQMPQKDRSQLAKIINQNRAIVVDDCCSFDLTIQANSCSQTLAGLVNPEQLIMIGTLSKMFWGGLRIGWIRAPKNLLDRIAQIRAVTDLGASVPMQLLAVDLLHHIEQARQQRKTFLRKALRLTEQVLSDIAPAWQWLAPMGGSGLWVEIGQDATKLAERAKRRGVKLLPGPSFCYRPDMHTKLRLPLWHEPDYLAAALSLALKP